MAIFNGALYFSADDSIHGAELWRSDGTEAGTVLVKDINPASSSSPVNIVAVDGSLYFAADDGTARLRAVEKRWHRGWNRPGQRYLPRLISPRDPAA